jgi:dihydrofolate synthase/folylpolyglutamate synthase
VKALSYFLEWLESHSNLEKEPVPDRVPSRKSLVRLSKLLEILGNPQRCAPVIHVTGTNGKGSTSMMVAHLLTEMQLRVGLYTSPDLESINERISVYPDPISNDEFCYFLSLIMELEKSYEVELSRFDILTICGFLYFQDQAVDVSVVEVGLGGTLDSTNVVDSDVAVVTNIDLDHTQILGNSLQLIARDKAGIIKANSRPVIGEQRSELRSIFLEACHNASAKSPFFYGQDFLLKNDLLAHSGHVIDVVTPYSEHQDLFIPLHGRYQSKNAAIAISSAEALFERSINPVLVKQAMGTLKIPGRLEVLSRRPLVVLDGAHNPAGAASLSLAIQEEFCPIDITLIVGMLKDKDADSFFNSLGLQQYVKEVIVCKPNSHRALNPVDLGEIVKRYYHGRKVSLISDPKLAFEYALSQANVNDMVLIAGSLYLVGNIRSIVMSHLDR